MRMVPHDRSVADCFLASDSTEGVVKQPVCGFFDWLVEHKGQGGNGCETELFSLNLVYYPTNPRQFWGFH